ncbi:hypothetical protein PED39_07000 [Methanomassiliicoccales archaeon LGM-RCC1]|nr:hypothetical protein PED39_07000 [Methanomassiliicoccales archaeon LGM-RCC1]
MNTKGMKFLAVLAVLAMAFAAFAVVAPAETDDAGVNDGVFTNEEGTTAVVDTGDITINANTTWYVRGAASITNDITINDGKTLTIAPVTNTAGTPVLTLSKKVTNLGTMDITGDTTIIVNGDGAAIYSGSSETTVKGTIIVESTVANALTITQGTVSYQNITTEFKGEIQDAVIKVGGTGTSKLTNNNITQKTAYAAWIDIANASNTISVTNNKFTADLDDGIIYYCIQVGGSTSQTFGNYTTVDLTKNTFTDIDDAKYFEAFGPYHFIGKGYGIGVSGTAGAEVIVDATIPKAQVNTGGNIGIASDLTITKLFILNGSVTVAAGKTLKADIDLVVWTTTPSLVLTANANGAVFDGTISHYTNKAVNSSADMLVKAGTETNLTIATGSVKVTGALGTLNGSKILATTGTVVLGNGAGSEFEVPATATLDLTGNVTGNVANAGTIVLESGADISDLNITGTGVIDDETSESDMKEIIIGGDSEGKSTVYSAKQLVTVSSEIKFWTLSEGSKVEIKGVLVIPEGTKLTVEADAELVIHKNAKLIVYGQLIIDKKTESAESAGKLTIDAGYVYVEGTVEMDGITSFENGDAIVSTVEVAESGLFTIGDDGTVTEDDYFEFIVDDGGYLVVYGTMGTVIKNSGSVTVDSDVAVTTSTTIYNMAANAVVEIENYTVKASANGTATLTISDRDLVFLTYWGGAADVDVKLANSEDKVVISTGLAVPSGEITGTDYSVTFSGLVVKSTVSSSSTSDGSDATKGIYNGKQYSKALVVEGLTSVDYTYIGNTTGRTDLTAQATVSTYTDAGDNKKYCAVKVVGAILIGDNVTIANTRGLLTVTGTITNESSAGLFTNAAKITVSNDGAISLLGSSINSETGISAAKFVVVAKDSSGRNYRIYNYYSIDGALAVVNAEAVTDEIVVLGSGQTVSKSTDLPSPITLVINTGADMKVKKDITLTIKDGATLKGEGTVNVDGTLYAEEKGDVKSALTIVADVKTEALDDKGKAARTGWIMWTNLAKALSDAEPGSIVTITKAADKFVTLSGNLTVPEGVTLELPENAAPLLLKNGVTLTVDGIIIVGSNIYAQQAFGLEAQNMKLTGTASRYSSAIVVNGAFISAVAVGYDDGYASVTDQDPKTPDANKIALLGGNFITGQGYITYNTVNTNLSSPTTAPIAGAYYQVKDGSKTLYVVSSLSYAAMVNDYIVGDITIHGKVAASVVAFKETNYFSTITVPEDGNVTAPTSTATGCAVGTSLSVLSLVLDGVTVTAISPVTGYIGDIDATMAFTAVKGIATDALTIKENDGKLYVTGTMVASATGSSASVSSGTVYLGTSDATFTYTGESNNLLIEKGAKAVVEKVTSISGIRVEGTFEVPANKTVPVTNLIDLGTVTVAPATSTTAKGSLTVTNLYIGADAAPKNAKTFATAAFNGPVTLVTSAIVMGDAELDYDALTALAAHYDTSFVIDDDVYYTVYAVANNVALSTYTVYKPLISEAVISAWLDENGDALANDAYIGTYDAVYAEIVTKIYSVTVITDSGIKSVAIDGIEMVRQSGTNIFTMGMTNGDYTDTLSKLKTGTYKITYTLYSTYQEDNNGVILYTADGTILKDMKFSASGASDYKTVSLQLNGTELIPEPAPEEQQSEWTITTILLVILVILIAVMAVIVALRLNRS